MSMDLLKKAKGRVQQSVSETFGSAQKTEFEPEFQQLLAQTDDVKNYLEKILAAVEINVQPDPTVRVMGLKHEGAGKLEAIAGDMSKFSARINDWHGDKPALGVAMDDGYKTFSEAASAERKYFHAVADNFSAPLKHFIQTEIKPINDERSTLNTKRLDMDTVKTKVHGFESKGKTVDEALKKDLELAENGYKDQLKKVEGMIVKMKDELSQVHGIIKAYLEAEVEFRKSQIKIFEDFGHRL